MIQRRRWERCRKELSVAIEAGGDTISSTTIDVCEGGIGMRSPKPFEIGSRLRFSIPDIAAGPMSGIVRWSTPSRGGAEHVIGVELDALSAAHRDALADRLVSWRAQSADEDA